MATWKSCVLLIAFLTTLSVSSAEIIGEYTCDPATTGNVGTFTIKLDENSAIDLVNVHYLDTTTGNPICTVAAVTAALVLETPDPGIKVGVNTLTVNYPTTATVPCGLSNPSTGVYVLDFVTQSLSNGAYSAEDRRFQIKCNGFTSATTTITATSFAASGVLVSSVGTLKVPDGLTLHVQVLASGAWVAPSAALPLGDPLRIQARLLIGSDSVTDFQLTQCTFRQAFGTTPKTSMILSANGANVCAKKAGEEIGFTLTDQAFTYSSPAGLRVATSPQLTAFTFFRTIDTGGTLPVMELSCTVTYCSSGCTDNSDCGANTGARRRRSVDTTTNNTMLYARFMVTTDPSKGSRDEISGAGGNAECQSLSNMGYMIGLIVLAALLVFAVAVTVFMFTRMNRPRDASQKA